MASMMYSGRPERKPPAFTAILDRRQFDMPTSRGSRIAQGALFVIPGGYRLLVGRDISDAAAFRDRIRTTLIWSGLVVLGLGSWAAR